MTLQAVACYFNPSYSRVMANNANRFLKEYASNTLNPPLTFVELGYAGRYDASRIPCPNIKYNRIAAKQSAHLIWQKEAVINYVVKNLPAEVTHVAWLDADIKFLNDAWSKDVLDALDDYAIVQCMDRVQTVNDDGKTLGKDPAGVAAAWPITNPDYIVGTAWAASRELFPIYDLSPIGFNAKFMWEACTTIQKHNTLLPETWMPAHLEVSERIHKFVNKKVGYIQGDVLHFWHPVPSAEDTAQMWQDMLMSSYTPAHLRRDQIPVSWSLTAHSQLKRYIGKYVGRRYDE